jgi:hypothetical protein
MMKTFMTSWCLVLHLVFLRMKMSKKEYYANSLEEPKKVFFNLILAFAHSGKGRLRAEINVLMIGDPSTAKS